jgi:hypothetical protein
MGQQLLHLDESFLTENVLIHPFRVIHKKVGREILYFNRCFLNISAKKKKILKKI